MRPALSVILFTVLSGAGLGLFALLTLVQLFGDADVTALAGTSNVEVKSFIVYPAFAVMGEF